MRNYLARKCINYLKEFGHNNLKAIPQIFCQIFNIEVSFLNNIHIINPKLALDPNFPKLKNMSLEGISALRKRIDRTFSQTITEKKNLLKTMVPKLIRPIMVMSNTWILFLPKQSR